MGLDAAGPINCKLTIKTTKENIMKAQYTELELELFINDTQCLFTDIEKQVYLHLYWTMKSLGATTLSWS